MERLKFKEKVMSEYHHLLLKQGVLYPKAYVYNKELEESYTWEDITDNHLRYVFL